MISPSMVLVLSSLANLGGLCAGIAEAVTWRDLKPRWERRYHTWDFLRDLGYIVGFSVLAYGLGAGAISGGRYLVWFLARLLLNKVAFEAGWRMAEKGHPFAYHDHPGYWRMAGLDGTRIEKWLQDSWLSRKWGIVVSEILLGGAGLWLLMGV